jgi:hypothetical protein
MTKQIKQLEQKSKYNLKRIMKRAWYLVKSESLTFSEALKQSWKESKEVILKYREKLSGAINRYKDQWSVQPHPEFWMKRDWAKNPDNVVSS